MRQKTFDRFFKRLLDHVAEMRLAFDHRFGEFSRFIEGDVGRERRHFRIRDRFEQYRTIG